MWLILCDVAGSLQVTIFKLVKKEIHMVRLLFCSCLLSLSGCQSAVDKECNSSKQEVGRLIKEMNAALMQSDDFIKS